MVGTSTSTTAIFTSTLKLPEDGDINGLHSVSLDSTEEDTGSPETADEDDDPYHPLFWLFCPQHHTTDDGTRESEALCTSAAVTPATNNFTYSFMVSQWIHSHQ